MRSISLRRRFTTITLAYRTFMHMLTWEDRLACLANLREHLAVGGRILMNLWAARREHVAAFIQERNGVMERVGDYDAPEDGSRITQFCSTSYDLEAQLLHEENLIYECAPDGEVRRTLILPMVRGWLTPGDMAHVVERAGLEAEAVYGDFDATPFTPEASEMVWILKQAGDPG
jgi:hypothetical protein